MQTELDKERKQRHRHTVDAKLASGRCRSRQHDEDPTIPCGDQSGCQSNRTVAEDDRVPGSLDHGCPHRSSRVMDRREPRIGDRIEFEKQALRGDSIESTLDATLTEHCVAGRINRAGAARDPRLVAFVKRCQDPNKTLLQYLVFGIIFPAERRGHL